MSDQQQRKGGKNLTTSPQRKANYLHYKSNKLREKHKVLRVLKASGLAAAEEYARAHTVEGFLRAYLAKRG